MNFAGSCCPLQNLIQFCLCLAQGKQKFKRVLGQLSVGTYCMKRCAQIYSMHPCTFTSSILSIYHLSTYVAIYLSIICPSVHLSVHPFICLSIYYLSIHLATVPLSVSSLSLSIHISSYLSVYRSIYPSNYLSIDLSICPCIYLSG